MDHSDDFYLVLPSNSSMSYFPDNAITCYTTHLSRELRLTGEWLVGLAEIHMPSTVIHIQKSESYYHFILGEEHPALEPDDDMCYFPHGVYESVEQLADEINKAKDVRFHQILAPADFQKGYYMIKRTCKCEQPHYTKFNEKIRRIFGFEDGTGNETIVTSSRGLSSSVASRPASLARAIPDTLYVYTDVCEPYDVGDTRTALLRIVAFENTKYRFGANIVKQFAPIHYIPLLHHNFQNIIVDIRDQHGDSILFTYGTLTVTLHFKRAR